jgi:hypothetical protein
MNNDMQAELERLRAENEALKSKGKKPFSLKIGKKGGVSAYGLGRFPVTLYKEQWEQLLEKADEIRAFIEANADKLKTRD